MVILLSNTDLAHAVFFKDGDKCKVEVYLDDDCPKGAKPDCFVQTKTRTLGYLYTTTKDEGNAFYKRLIARGWVRS